MITALHFVGRSYRDSSSGRRLQSAGRSAKPLDNWDLLITTKHSRPTAHILRFELRRKHTSAATVVGGLLTGAKYAWLNVRNWRLADAHVRGFDECPASAADA